MFSGTPADFAKTARMLDDLGLERTAVTANGDPQKNLISEDPVARQAGVDYMKWALDCTAALGAQKD